MVAIKRDEMLATIERHEMLQALSVNPAFWFTRRASRCGHCALRSLDFKIQPPQ